MPPLTYHTVDLAPGQSSAQAIAGHLLSLMLRNVATEVYVFADPVNAGVFSRPGCVIASPSYADHPAAVNQDYIFNWTRDGAITAMELAAAPIDTTQALADYVRFARACQTAGGAPIHRGAYRIDGRPRDGWSDQSDGPALRVMAILRAWPRLDDGARATATDVVAADLACVLAEHRKPTTSLWEERHGASFFARSVQLRCLSEIRANTLKLTVPPGVDDAIAWLQAHLDDDHWRDGRYVSVLEPPGGYDPNIDIVLAALHGAVAVTDPKLLATAAQIRAQWSDPSAATCYRINQDDEARGIGPLLGRYPGDSYDGDTQDPDVVGHPWALCTAAFAELYYRVAKGAADHGALPDDPLASAFFEQVGIAAATPVPDAVQSLRDAGDRMLRALIFHSDHLELSEQFDATTGYEKSVRNLTWSYASFLSALRARDELP